MQHERSGSVVVIGVGLAALGLLFQSEIVAAVTVWRASTAYNHCFLIIPIAAYLLWERRALLHAVPPRPCAIAVLAGLPLALAWLLAERIGIMEGRQLIAMSFVELLFFVVLGPRLWWSLAGPLLYLYFLVPFGAFLTPKLQDITTVFVAHGLPLLHIPAYVDGYTIEIPEGTFMVAEACAGLRFLVAAVAFGCLYALMMYRTPMRRAAFIVASIVVPVVANGFRVLGIVALGHYMGSAQAVEADHVVYGWVFFSAVILLLIVLGLPFRQDHGAWTVPDVPMASTLHASRQALFGTLALIVLAAIGPALAARIDRTSTAVVADLPLPAPPADCVVQPMRAADVDAPATRFVCAKGAVMLTVQVFSPRASVAQLLGSQRRLTGAADGADVETRLVGTWLLTVPEPPGKPVASCLWIDGQPATLGLATRMRQAWHSLFGAPYRPVLLAVSADEPDRRRAAQSLVDFVQTQSALGKYGVQLSANPKSDPAVGSARPAPG